MKKYVFLILAMPVFGMSSCSSSDENVDETLIQEMDSSNGDVDETLIRGLDNTKPLFTHEDFKAINHDYDETTNGTWMIRKTDGILNEISFFTQGVDPAPSPASPKTVEEFFSDFLPLTTDNQMVFLEKDYREDPHYLQYYKGVLVEKGWWHISFLDGMILGGYGCFVPIGDLDVSPSVNLATAKKIVENYIHESVEGESKSFYLSIMSFPENGKLQPRLVYVYKRQVWEEGEFAYVDAKTGQLLYCLAYEGGAPW